MRHASGRVETPGVVEHLSGRAIRGWIDVDAAAPVHKVGLYIDEVMATSVTAMPIRGERNTRRQIRTFNFTLHDLWKYTTRTSRITVRVNGHHVPFAGHGMYYAPVNDGELSLGELGEQQAKGWIFTSDGKFRLNKNSDHQWQADVMSLYHRVFDVVHGQTGYETFLVYGSLLGAVRDNGFIGHDFDVDTAYVSAKETGEQAAEEALVLGRQLLASGLMVEARVVCLHVYDPEKPDVRIDLFHLYWHPETDALRFAWGLAGKRRFSRDMWQGVEEIPFAGTTARIPRNAQALVEAIYGATWRIPNAGFTWEGNRNKRAVEARIDATRGEELNWDSYYTFATPRDASSFAAQLLDGAGLPRAIVDLGCGDGRDSLAFARGGHAVLGLDRSSRAIELAKRHAEDLPGELRPAYSRCNFADAGELAAALTGARNGDEPLAFYGRFLLHALPEPTARTLLDTVYAAARPGDRLLLEFRTTDDAKLTKTRWLPFRRFVDADALLDELGAQHFDEIETQRGTGLAPQDREDPFIARICATRTG